jgi:hypothetical protein
MPPGAKRSVVITTLLNEPYDRVEKPLRGIVTIHGSLLRERLNRHAVNHSPPLVQPVAVVIHKLSAARKGLGHICRH